MVFVPHPLVNKAIFCFLTILCVHTYVDMHYAIRQDLVFTLIHSQNV